MAAMEFSNPTYDRERPKQKAGANTALEIKNNTCRQPLKVLFLFLGLFLALLTAAVVLVLMLPQTEPLKVPGASASSATKALTDPEDTPDTPITVESNNINTVVQQLNHQEDNMEELNSTVEERFSQSELAQQEQAKTIKAMELRMNEMANEIVSLKRIAEENQLVVDGNNLPTGAPLAGAHFASSVTGSKILLLTQSSTEKMSESLRMVSETSNHPVTSNDFQRTDAETTKKGDRGVTKDKRSVQKTERTTDARTKQRPVNTDESYPEMEAHSTYKMHARNTDEVVNTFSTEVSSKPYEGTSSTQTGIVTKVSSVNEEGNAVTWQEHNETLLADKPKRRESTDDHSNQKIPKDTTQPHGEMTFKKTSVNTFPAKTFQHLQSKPQEGFTQSFDGTTPLEVNVITESTAGDKIAVAFNTRTSGKFQTTKPHNELIDPSTVMTISYSSTDFTDDDQLHEPTRPAGPLEPTTPAGLLVTEPLSFTEDATMDPSMTVTFGKTAQSATSHLTTSELTKQQNQPVENSDIEEKMKRQETEISSIRLELNETQQLVERYDGRLKHVLEQLEMKEETIKSSETVMKSFQDKLDSLAAVMVEQEDRFSYLNMNMNAMRTDMNIIDEMDTRIKNSDPIKRMVTSINETQDELDRHNLLFAQLFDRLEVEKSTLQSQTDQTVIRNARNGTNETSDFINTLSAGFGYPNYLEWLNTTQQEHRNEVQRLDNAFQLLYVLQKTLDDQSGQLSNLTRTLESMDPSATRVQQQLDSLTDLLGSINSETKNASLKLMEHFRLILNDSIESAFVSIRSLQQQQTQMNMAAATQNQTQLICEQRYEEITNAQSVLNFTIGELEGQLLKSQGSIREEIDTIESRLNSSIVADLPNVVRELREAEINASLQERDICELEGEIGDIKARLSQNAESLQTMNQSVANAEKAAKTASVAVAGLMKKATACCSTANKATCLKKCAASYTLNPHSNTCYKMFATGKNWNQAKDSCINDEGGYLATPDSLQSANWLFDQIRSNQAFRSDGAWLGGKRGNNGWEWQGRLTGPFTYNKWAPGQPDWDGACLEALGDDGFNDGKCYWTHRNYICEQEMVCSESA
ncbi:putative leucine-rich repeat-containing protein DDB_G0290503 [Watersipora subatra]|uniref:putative leucine-rich repeat-containing protein DDB_G0290503 n=1 Tax=Watersipora subatra TaxID=2589382 RepID=UPI00355C6D8F